MKPYLKVTIKDEYELEFVMSILPLYRTLSKYVEVQPGEVIFWRNSVKGEYTRKSLTDQWLTFASKLYTYRHKRKETIELFDNSNCINLEDPPFKEKTVKYIFDSLDEQTKKCVYLFVGSAELLSVEGNRLIDIFVKLEPEEKKVVANILMSSLGLFVE